MHNALQGQIDGIWSHKDPTDNEFRAILKRIVQTTGIEYHQAPVDYLLETHYQATGRPMRFCHPRDLLHQVRIYCDFNEQPVILTHEAIDAAVKNYFAVL